MFLVKSVGVCILGGALFGAAAWLLIDAAGAKDPWRLSYFPVIAFYALPIAIPFGMLSGVIATLVFRALSRSKWQPSSRRAWICTGGTSGLIMGATLPAFLRAIYGGIEGLFWGAVGGGAGMSCGFVLGWLAWKELRREGVG